MNIIKKHIFRAFAAMSLCAVAASCSQEEFGLTQDDERPLKLIATVEGMASRAADTDSWAKGDIIRVRIDNGIDKYPWIGQYELNPDGTVKDAIDALAWPYTDGYVSAWFPFFGLNESLDVTINDQSKGYHAFDFMCARTDEQKHYTDIVNLTFKHQMSKATCTLTKGEGVTDEDLATAKVSYYGYTKALFSEDGLSGDEHGLITPASDFSALLVPQEMTGKSFIQVDLTVTVNDVPIEKTLIYSPEELTLVAGSAYNFNITVQKDRLVVQTIKGEWTDVTGEGAKADLRRVYLPANHGQTLKFSSNTTLAHDDEKDLDYLLLQDFEFSISFKANNNNRMSGFSLPDDCNYHKVTRSEANGNYIFEFKLDRQVPDDFTLEYGEFTQVGDFFYADGTWGRYHPDAWSKEDNPDGVKIIGIVFKVGVSGTGPKNNPGNVDIPANYSGSGWEPARIKGYVVALEDASPNTGSFAPTTNKTYCPPNTGTNNGAWNNVPYSGYINTYTIRTSPDTKSLYESTDVNAPNVKSLWAFKVAVEYQPAPYPGESSGWYLPSARQWDDILHLYGLRSLLEEAGGTNIVIDPAKYYWSCTEANNAYTWVFFPDQDSFASKGKNNTASGFVRSVLTF